MSSLFVPFEAENQQHGVHQRLDMMGSIVEFPVACGIWRHYATYVQYCTISFWVANGQKNIETDMDLSEKKLNSNGCHQFPYQEMSM